MRYILSILFVTFIFNDIKPQRLLTGQILDTDGKNIDYALIYQVNKTDSSVIATGLTDKDGHFSIEGKENIQSYLLVSSLGYNDYIQNIPEKGNFNFNKIMLYQEMSGTLDEVSIVAFRPRIEQKSDRFVFTTQGLPMIGGNGVLDILKHVPFIAVDGKNSLSMIGKDNVIIYINGRKSMLSGESLIQYLKNTPADNIKNIEVISNPNSTYSSEGNFGVINIVLKKEEWEGTQGSIRFSDSQNKFNNTQNGNINLSFRKRKIGVNMNAWGGNNIYTTETYSRNDFLESSTKVESNNRSHQTGGNVGGYINMDYNINDKHTLGIIFNGSYNKTPRNRFDISSYSSIDSPIIDSLMRSTIAGKNKSNQISINLNYFYKIDSLGSYLSSDFDYLHNYGTNTSHTIGDIIDSNNQVLHPFDNFIQRVPVFINNWSGKIEYQKIFNTQNSLTIGVNSYGTKTDNDSYFGVWDGTNFNNDNNRSNHFIYSEIISALYASYKRTWNKNLETTIGLRGEYSHNEGDQKNGNIKFSNNNFRIFPTFYISYKGFLSYSITNRIRRPSFSDLNPFKYYISATNYVVSNPFLKSSNSLNQELCYILKHKYIFKTYYNITFDDWSLFDIPEENDVIRFSPINYGKKMEYGLTFVQNQQVFKGIWQMNNSVTYFYNKLKGDVEGEELNRHQHSVRIFLDNTFTLSKKKGWSANVTFSYNSPIISGTSKIYSSNSLNFSITKQFKNFNIYLWINDVYCGERSAFKTTTDKLVSYTDNDFGTRKYGITLTYNFGNQKVYGSRQRGTSNDEIKSRTY